MLNETQKEKIQRFLDDKLMSDAVYSVLLDSFLDDKVVNDVNYLAASRISVIFLKRAWNQLESFKREKEIEDKDTTNIGL